jgi:dipeptidyl aminopeptidase/acylaminoacyl peptidase
MQVFRPLTHFRSSVLTATLALVLGLALMRCGTARETPVAASAEDTTSAGPALSFLLDREQGIRVHEARSEAATTLVPKAAYTGAAQVSPDGRHLAFSYEADSARLAILDLETGALQPVHAETTDVVYSLAWHATADTLAFGYYAPASDGTRGAGGIRLATPEGPVRSVGCRAAREVLHWLPNGTLAVRDDDNLYLVAPSDCTTRARLDIRQKHRLAYSADGRFLTYVLQDLRYVRDRGEYVPDSTLFISDPRGQDARKLFGDARKVRHLQWSPGGPELAFDLLPEDNSTHRQIVVYNAAEEQTSYLVPPEDGDRADQIHPRWSPSGSYLAFVQRRSSGQTAAVRVAGRTQQLGATTGPVQWATDRRIVVPGPDSLRVQTLRGGNVYVLPAKGTLIHAWGRAPL